MVGPKEPYSLDERSQMGSRDLINLERKRLNFLPYWTADTGVRHRTTANRVLWRSYFLICFFFLTWPFNALSLVIGIFLKHRTAARYAPTPKIAKPSYLKQMACTRFERHEVKLTQLSVRIP